jgi:hypothetical protein
MATAAKKSAASATPAFQVTGTYTGLKTPQISGIVVLHDNTITSYTATAPSAVSTDPTAESPLTNRPAALCGDITNGVAITDGTSVAYLTGVGVVGAKWNSLPDLPPPLQNPSDKESVAELCGDLANGLIAYNSYNLFNLTFSSMPAPYEWYAMAALPGGTLTTIAGDPTNGVLLVMTPETDAGQPSGPSVLYYSLGCSCAWVPVTNSGPGLPVVKVQVDLACGNGSGFVIYGENQLFTLSLKYAPATATAAASCIATSTTRPSPPFQVDDLSGDPTNGCTAICASSGLIATTTGTFASWTVINAVPPDQSQS